MGGKDEQKSKNKKEEGQKRQEGRADSEGGSTKKMEMRNFPRGRAKKRKKKNVKKKKVKREGFRSGLLEIDGKGIVGG